MENNGRRLHIHTTRKTKKVVKWNSEFCATSKNLKRWNEQTHQSCPICGFDGETTDHILRCPHPSTITEWKKSIRSLKEWMMQQSTAPAIISAIEENLNAWRENRPAVAYEGPMPGMSKAIEAQNDIGWSPFIRGFVAVEWKEIQSQHLKLLKSKRSHKRWLKMIIIKFWQISWDMWRFRNGILHSQSPTSTTNYSFLLMTEILKEKEYGGTLLPPTCRYLFSQPQEKLLNSTINNKILWLANAWSARDTYTPADIINQNRNKIIHAHVIAWKKKLK